MGIRLLAITDPGCAVSTRYRVTHFEPYLRQRQVDLKTLAWASTAAEQASLLESVAESDVVVFQRYLPGRRWLRTVRRRARRLVYDFDDAVIFHESARRKPRLKLNRWWRFREMMRCCDAVTAGNSYLAELAQRHAERRRVFVLPTTVELERYDREPFRAEAGPVLGWIGAQSTLPYLEQLERPLECLSEEMNGLTVHVITSMPPKLGKTRVEWIPWAAATELRELKRLRLGLAPLPDDAWTRGKCGLRLLQYLAAGVPALASPVGTQSEIIRSGAALPASSESDWIDRMRQVLTDDALAADLAARGRQLVSEQFNARSWVDRLRVWWCGEV